MGCPARWYVSHHCRCQESVELPFQSLDSTQVRLGEAACISYQIFVRISVPSTVQMSVFSCRVAQPFVCSRPVPFTGKVALQVSGGLYDGPTPLIFCGSSRIVHSVWGTAPSSIHRSAGPQGFVSGLFLHCQRLLSSCPGSPRPCCCSLSRCRLT